MTELEGKWVILFTPVFSYENLTARPRLVYSPKSYPGPRYYDNKDDAERIAQGMRARLEHGDGGVYSVHQASEFAAEIMAGEINKEPPVVNRRGASLTGRKMEGWNPDQ